MTLILTAILEVIRKSLPALSFRIWAQFLRVSSRFSKVIAGILSPSKIEQKKMLTQLIIIIYLTEE